MEDDALTQRFIQIRASVLGYLRVMVRDPALAEDLFQDTYLVVLKRIETFDSTQDFDLWVKGVARNLARNALRKRARTVLIPSTELVKAIDDCHDEASCEEADITAKRLRFLHECIAHLTDRQKTVMALRYHANKSMKAIGEELQSTPGSIQAIVTRIRQSLLDCITNKNEVIERAN